MSDYPAGDGALKEQKPKPEVHQDLVKLIEAALRRATLVKAEGIVTEVVDGKVFLRGHVRSALERELAEEAAWKAPGVTVVENHVIVIP